jgi:hypothetical protein
MLGKMIGEEAGVIERFELLQAFSVEPEQRHIGQMLDVIEDAKPDSAHAIPRSPEPCAGAQGPPGKL